MSAKGTAAALLPEQAGAWKWDGKEETYDSRTLFAYMDGAAELYLAYGFQSLTVRRMERPGHPRIVAELYRMGSAADAYGVFSYERQDEGAGIGQGSEFGGGLLRFWKGEYFASIYAEGEGPEAGAAIQSLGRAIAGAIGRTGSPPALLKALPNGRSGLAEKSIRYLHSHILLNQRFFIAHQNILNLSPKTEAVLAQYVREGKKLHLLLVRYPDEKAADAALRSFKKAYMPEAKEKGIIRTEDKNWSAAEREGQFGILVFGAATQEEAESFIRRTKEKIPLAKG